MHYLTYLFSFILNPVKWYILRRSGYGLKIYYGCGNVQQSGYINVDIRWTPAVDLLGDLRRCSRILEGRCSEVYLSHVLEHYRSPGKERRESFDTIHGALRDIYKMLEPGGVVRIAVPDFAALCRLYLSGQVALHPRLAGRIMGEQNYPENLHRCIFDAVFLEQCFQETGFERCRQWRTEDVVLAKDASFDMLEGSVTSLNLMAFKRSA